MKRILWIYCPDCDEKVNLERPLDEVPQEYECKNCGRKAPAFTAPVTSMADIINRINAGELF